MRLRMPNFRRMSLVNNAHSIPDYDHNDNILSYMHNCRSAPFLACIITDHGGCRFIHVQTLIWDQSRCFGAAPIWNVWVCSENQIAHLASKRTWSLNFGSIFCRGFTAIMRSFTPGDCGESHVQAWQLNRFLGWHEPNRRGAEKEQYPYNRATIADAPPCI